MGSGSAEVPRFFVQSKDERTCVVYRDEGPNEAPSLYAFVTAGTMNRSTMRQKANLDLDPGPYNVAEGFEKLGPLLAPEAIEEQWRVFREAEDRTARLRLQVEERIAAFEPYDPETEGRMQFLQRFADLVAMMRIYTGEPTVRVQALAEKLGVTRVTVRRWLTDIRERGIVGYAGATDLGYQLHVQAPGEHEVEDGQ